MSPHRRQELEEGEELAGRYRLEENLGSGAMGEVWRALDLYLDRKVAVKVLPIDGSDAQTDRALARFHREGKASARLSHPRIAAVHDIVAGPAGGHGNRPFLVLELLAGPDLAALLRRHPGGLPIEQALEYGAQVSEGLAAAHAAGVIHRDVKPSNVMLDGSGNIKICDFGIAHLEDATAGLTVGFLGTPAYLPPEQALGGPITGAADVYALGATLFHLLTGQLPHRPPPPPSSLRPDIPPALDGYLATLLDNDPASRPPIHTIAAGLRAITTGAGQARPGATDALTLPTGCGPVTTKVETTPEKAMRAARFTRSPGVGRAWKVALGPIAAVVAITAIWWVPPLTKQGSSGTGNKATDSPARMDADQLNNLKDPCASMNGSWNFQTLKLASPQPLADNSQGVRGCHWTSSDGSDLTLNYLTGVAPTPTDTSRFSQVFPAGSLREGLIMYETDAGGVDCSFRWGTSFGQITLELAMSSASLTGHVNACDFAYNLVTEAYPRLSQ